MKYLESFGQSPLWEKIDKREFCGEIENSEFVNFDERERLNLKSTFSKFYNSYFTVTHSDNAIFWESLFSFKKRVNTLGHALNKSISGLIYTSGGKGAAHKIFYIGKLDDEWYLVEYITMTGGKKESSYYKCDQLDGFLSLLNSLTNKLKKRDFDLEKQKSDRNKKIQNIITKLKSMSWDEFVSFYDNFSRS